MSDTVLGGKMTVYYLDDNRRKQWKWTGTTAKTDVQKMIDVYDAFEDLMTIVTQQDDGLILSAETPGQYTTGIIDSGDLEPWFVDMKTMEHIVGDFANFTGCALKTSGWTRDLPGDGTGAVGILVVPVTSGGTIAISDIGDTLAHASGDTGTLLDFVDTGGATDYLFIRPTDNTLANDFNTGSLAITMDTSANSATQSAIGHTGEMVWGNIYTQGALLSDTHIFVFQNGERVTISDDTDNDWWPDGQVDRAFPIKDYTTSAFPTIDLGYMTVKANQYGSKHTYSVIRMDTTTGGNVSAGLSSGDDITNTTGYASITLSGDSGNFTVGDEIQDDTNDARGIITLITGTTPTRTLHYYLVGDPLTDFDGGAITNNDDTGAATGSSAPTAQGPTLTTWFDGSAFPTYTFANAQADIDGDTVNEEYGITIDLNQATLAQMHEYNKYSQRRGSTLDHDGLDGQEWIGLDYAVNYATITGTVPEGSTVTGKVSGATGVVVSNPAGTSNTALLRDSRGTFQDGEAIYETDGVNEFAASGLTVEVITPVAESSFGTLAGTTYFASRGVLLSDYKTTEENNFSLIDATGTPRARPTTISMSILNLLQYDWASCFRLTGALGSVDKTEYSATGAEVAGGTTLTVDGTIAVDVPGNTLGGSLVLVDVSDANKEYVIRYDSFVVATGVVTLSNIDIALADAGTNTTTIVEASAFTDAKVGDIVYNHNQTAVSYVTSVDSVNQVTISPAITGQTTNDHIELNCIPIALVDTADAVYFPIIFEFQESDGSTSASMQYLADIFTRVRVRNTSAAAIKIKGYTADVTIDSGGGTASATRITNTVYGS